MNILVDTNVLLSAALRDGLPEKVVLFVAAAADYRWIVTSDIQQEYLEVLKRPKFGLSQEIIEHWAELIEMRTIVVANPPINIDFPRDPKDAPFLAAALVTNADYLITGDKDLLQARTTLSTRIVTVSEFIAELNIA